ncbi:C40 family peptidase [Litoreibacter roseus]|uniref:NlpC/P60 domain-containing protein n=1 Tax=Litoreibacter roseus TaxID=2601869 RepID=A0A6N6JED3_9RHOB|nr:NlpC/P60 family protein [Litoreibacter roseus]GFE64711.1 hypothetical protein KIN_17850 [Litoreibacter roseus]
MTDARLTPSNERVAAAYLEGQVDAPRYVEGELLQCTCAAADILGKPGGRRTSQLLFGDLFNVLEVHKGHAFGQSVYDGYCGYIREDLLGRAEDATHWVSVPATHLYPAPHLKVMTQGALYFGSEVSVIGIEGTWSRLSGGQCVPSVHLQPIGERRKDPVAVADLLLGTPYLWGGSSRYGIDCSGLIQICWRACGRECPRDSDMQEQDIGHPVEMEDIRRGDLVFWDGHVGLMTSDSIMIHANAHHMAVAYEPLEDAIQRIDEAGDGPVTSIKRPE